MTQRWAACVEYQGTHYYGWQTQEIEGKSVQPWVEQALSRSLTNPSRWCAAAAQTLGFTPPFK